MRCAAATYEILGHLKLLKAYSTNKTVLKVLYPKILRRKLFKEARRQGWQVELQEGSNKRIWEKD